MRGIFETTLPTCDSSIFGCVCVCWQVLFIFLAASLALPFSHVHVLEALDRNMLPCFLVVNSAPECGGKPIIVNVYVNTRMDVIVIFTNAPFTIGQSDGYLLWATKVTRGLNSMFRKEKSEG